MINYQLRLKQLLLTSFFLLITISCHDNTVTEELNLVDADMIAATKLAEEYLSSSKGRNGSEKSITVLKFKDGKLLYSTNTDDNKSYQDVTEETITATVEPGEHIFWYSGGGVTDLEGVDFEDETQLPEEINPDKMWIITVPEDVEEGTLFKYDIVYQFKGNSGPPIVLDPKIKIQD